MRKGARVRGVWPWSWRARVKSAAGPGSEPYVFISYSKDVDYVAQLAEALTAESVPVWWDHQLATGDRWDKVLRERVDNCAALVVVMSPHSEGSRFVRLEVGRARWREGEGSRVRPILLAGKGLPYVADLQHERVSEGRVIPAARFVAGLRTLLAAPPPRRRPGKGEVIGSWPGHHPRFVGRTDLLVDLEANLYAGAPVAVEALQGMGGVGKTQLAAEYVHRRRGDYDLLVWVDAERPELVPEQLARLAGHLGVTTVPDDVPATAAAGLRALSDTDLAWLLVFDNAGSPADSEGRPSELLAWLPRNGSGHVILTSRHTGWRGAGVETIR